MGQRASALALDLPADLRGRHPLPAGVTLHPSGPDDAPAIGLLCARAFRGGIDDGGRSDERWIDDVAAAFRGEYGAIVPAGTLLARRDGRLVAASIVTDDPRGPLLAFLATAPREAGCGTGTALVAVAADALAADGRSSLALVVTEGNPAERLYRRLGFRVVRTFERDDDD